MREAAASLPPLSRAHSSANASGAALPATLTKLTLGFSGDDALAGVVGSWAAGSLPALKARPPRRRLEAPQSPCETVWTRGRTTQSLPESSPTRAQELHVHECEMGDAGVASLAEASARGAMPQLAQASREIAWKPEARGSPPGVAH